MAQNISFPEAVSFRDNPIVVGFQTFTSNKLFLKAVLEAKISVMDSNGHARFEREEKYSIPLELISNEKVSFDLSPLAGIIEAGYEKDPNSFLGFILKERVFLDIKAYEEYLLDGIIIKNPNPNEGSSFPESNQAKSRHVISGGLTDYERTSYFFNTSNTLKDLIGNCKILSRKPSGELFHPDSIITVPAVANSDTPVSAFIMVDRKTMYGEESKNLEPYRCFLFRRSVADILSQHPEAKTLYISIGGKNTPLGYIGRKKGKAYHFSFKNGFGMLESITCYSQEKLTAEMETTESFTISRRSLVGVSESITKKGKITSSYLLSTGIINKDWCEWFVSEFFASDEHYLFIKGNWVPVSVIPDDKITLYDENKPAPISIDFTVKPRFNGFINDKFIQ